MTLSDRLLVFSTSSSAQIFNFNQFENNVILYNECYQMVKARDHSCLVTSLVKERVFAATKQQPTIKTVQVTPRIELKSTKSFSEKQTR